MTANSRRDVRVTTDGRHADVTTQTETETKTLTTPSSRSDAQRRIERTNLARLAGIDERDAAAKLVLTLRPDWPVSAVLDWLHTDDRSWAQVCLAALRAGNRDVRTPTQLRYVGAEYDGRPTPTPMRFEQWRDAERCVNGAIHDPHPCALCRAGATT